MNAVVCVGPSFDEGDEDSFHEGDFIVKGTQWKNELQEYHRQSTTSNYHEEIITETTTDGRTIQKLVRTYPGEETETVEEYEAVEIDGKVTSVTHTVTGAEKQTASKQNQLHSQKQEIQEKVHEQIVTEITADGRKIQKKILTYPGEVTETIEESEVTQVGDEITEVKRQVENKPISVKETIQSPLDPGKQEVVIVPGHQKVEYDPISKTKTVTEKTTTGYQQTITTVTTEGLTKTQIKTFFDAVEIPGDEEETIEEETTTTETTTPTANQSAPRTAIVQQQVSNQTKSDQVNTSNQVATTQNKLLSDRSTNESARVTTAISKTTKEVTSSEQSVRIVSSSGEEPITTATASETKVQTSAVSAAQQTKTKQIDGTEKIEEYEETQAKEVKISGIVKVTPTGAVQKCEKSVQLTESVTEKIDDDETTIINETLETESHNQMIPVAKALQQLPTGKVSQNAIENVQTKAIQQATDLIKNTKKDVEQTINTSAVDKQVKTTDSKVVIMSKIVNDDGEEVTEEIRHFPGGREHITKTLRIDGTTKMASKTFYDEVPVEKTTTTTEETTTTEKTTKAAQNVQNTEITKNIKDQTNKVAEVKDSKNVTETVTKKTTVDDTTKVELIWEATNENGEVETEEVRHFPGGREHIVKLLRIDGTTKVSSKTVYDPVPTEETCTIEETITTTEQSKVAQSTTAAEQLASVARSDTEQKTKDSRILVDNNQTVKKSETDNTTKIELVWETKNDNGDIESEEIRHFPGGREHITKLVRADGTVKVSSKTFYDAMPTEKTVTTEETSTTTTVTNTEQTEIAAKKSEQLSKVATQNKTDQKDSKQTTNVTQAIEEKTDFNSTTKVEIVWQTKNDNGEEITEEIRHFPGGREHITKTVCPNGTTRESSKTFYDAVPTDETIVTESDQAKVIVNEQQLSKVAHLTKDAQKTKATETTTKTALTNEKTKVSSQNIKTNQIVQNTEQSTTKVAQQTNDKKTKIAQDTNKAIEKKLTDTTTNVTRIELVSTVKQKNGDTVTEEIRHFPGGRECITKTLRADGTTKMASKTFYDAVPIKDGSNTTTTEDTKTTSTAAATTKTEKKGSVSTTDTQIAATTTNTTKIELVSTTTNKEGEKTTEHIRHFPGGREHIFKTLRADGTTKCGSSKTVFDAVPVAGEAGNDEEIEDYEEIVEEHSSSTTKTENSQTTSTTGDTQVTSTVSASSTVDIETSAKKKLPTAPASKRMAAPAVKAKEASTPVPPPRKKEVKKPAKGK